MSRIGKKIIVIPRGVKVAVNGDSVLVEGSKGKLSLAIPFGIFVENKDEKVFGYTKI